MNSNRSNSKIGDSAVPFPMAAWRAMGEAAAICVEIGVEICVSALTSPTAPLGRLGGCGKRATVIMGDVASVVLRATAWWILPSNLPFSIKAPAFVVVPLTLATLHATGFRLTAPVWVAILGAYSAGIYSLTGTVRWFRHSHFQRIRDLASIRDRIETAAENGTPAEFNEAMADLDRILQMSASPAARHTSGIQPPLRHG
jgi:hypothetical protein